MYRILAPLLLVAVSHVPALASEQPVRLLITVESQADLDRFALVSKSSSNADARNARAIKSFRQLNTLAVATLSKEADVQQAITQFRNMPGVKSVEVDHKLKKTATPNDTQYTDQWHLKSGFGVNLEPAWDLTTGDANLVVAVIDTGMDYNHTELVGKIWQNPGEVAGDGIDNDGNGYIDDIRGINPAESTVDPMDEDGHGTQIGSIIAANSNNSVGIAAINWQLQLLPCRFMDVNGEGFVSDAIECLDYVLDLKLNHGVNIVATNNSWGSPLYSQALYDAISLHNDADILFVASAGNSNTSARFYPAGYDLPNIISVSAHDIAGVKASFANYGREWVDISAPGVNVLSADLNNGISLVSGTSVAAPVVTGVAALLKSAEPGLTTSQIRSRLLMSGKPATDATLQQQTTTGRLLVASGSGQIGAFNCTTGQVQRRLKPASDRLYLSANDVVNIEILSQDCSGNSISTAVTMGDAATAVTVRDDGTLGDSFAADGIYTGNWTFDGNATYLTFVDGVIQVSPRIEDFCVQSNVSEIPREECNALVQLYYDTQGQDWTNQAGWLESATPCSWYGVTCTNGRVTALALNENGLKGIIPDNFSQLSELTSLDFSFNVLEGNFPATFLQLTKLQKLILWNNALEGTIPPSISNLSAMTELDLSFNRFSGTVPSQLGNLTQLEKLFLEDNLFTGTVPTTFGQLSRLLILWLENNSFSGTLPSNLTNLTRLQAFSFAGTDLCPPITASFAAWLAQIDTLEVNNSCPNTAPSVSVGGAQTVASGATVQLTATASDAEFNTLTYLWQQTAGTPVTLNGAQSLNASFTAPTVTSTTQLVFSFTANDGKEQTSANVTITVSPNNTGGGGGGGSGGGDSGGSSGGGTSFFAMLALTALIRFRLGKVC